MVGIVENPQSLLDTFALVAPGQVAIPTQVMALFDAPGVPAPVDRPPRRVPGVGGAREPVQSRSIGMLESTGATDRHVSLVVRANGAVVGAVGAL